MRKLLILFFVFLMLPPCFARDFIVEIAGENYKEVQSSLSYSPLMYHSLQVRSEVGPKLLILTGNNVLYRKWLREYIAEDKAFIVKVPDNQKDFFISSSAFEIDVTHLHPFNLSLYRKSEGKNKLNPVDLALEATKKAETALIEQKKKQAATMKQKVIEKKASALEEERKRLEKEKQISDKQTANNLKLKQELDQKKIEQEQLRLTQEAQKAIEAKQRREEFEQRWLEIKRRLLEEEKIKGLDQEARNREIETRWLEFKQRFGQE
jgi:hypothetical protein